MGAIIAEWSSRYLAEVAKHSEMRHYHPMSSLLIRFYIHNPNPKGPNINGEDAAKADLQVITNGGRLQYPPLAHMIGSNEKPDSRVIRKLLEKNEMILALGTKRGRTYGNINARPVLTDETIAAIVVKILEVNLGQYRWWDLYAPVFGMI